MNINALIRFLFFFVVINVPVHANQTAVGKISFSKGSNAAQQANAELRLLGKEAEIYQGDNIQTSDDSVVMLEFIDHSKAVIRPNSNFKIEQFDNDANSVVLHLYAGNMHIRTGNTSSNFQIKTPTEILTTDKNSDYSVSICEGGCNSNSSQESAEKSVAKVVEIKGDIFAKNTFDKTAAERKLSLGSEINVHDHLSSQTNSFLVLVFKDNQKITLQPNSEFDVTQYDYQQAGKKDQIKFKLITGGLRALTGTIGQKDHSAYALDTPVATIGIRGTETEHIENPDGSGIYSHVTEGSISITNEAGEIILNQGENAFTASSNSLTAPISELPQIINFQLENTPRPSHAPNFMNNPRVNGEGSIVKLNNKGTPPMFGNKDERGLNKFSPPNGLKGIPDGMGFKSTQAPMPNFQHSSNLNRNEALMPKFGMPLELSDNAENHNMPDFKLAGNTEMGDNNKQFIPIFGEGGENHLGMNQGGFDFSKNAPDMPFSDKELNASIPQALMNQSNFDFSKNAPDMLFSDKELNASIPQALMNQNNFDFSKNAPDMLFSEKELNASMPPVMNIGDMLNNKPDNFSFDSVPAEIKNAGIIPILQGKLHQKVNEFVMQEGKLNEDTNYNFTFDEMKLKGEPNISIPSISHQFEAELGNSSKTTDILTTTTSTNDAIVETKKTEIPITIPITEIPPMDASNITKTGVIPVTPPLTQ